ncbi:hypothetical protein QHF84_27130 [Polyangium sp. y55x31]|nr:hypothetical protein [Polyangium sp. y55x31]
MRSAPATASTPRALGQARAHARSHDRRARLERAHVSRLHGKPATPSGVYR